MPKLKSHRGATKRFKITPRGKIRRRKAFHNHNLGKKQATRKRRLTAPELVAESDEKRVRRMLAK
jgi:large subunit ribosomal protein L35